MKRLLVWAACVGLLGAACNSPNARLNAPPHGIPPATHELQGTYVYMNDNALLEDMAVSDVHFLPHRRLLNTLGEERLLRLASLVEAYGGTIRFSTALEDEALIEERTETILAFLAEAGLDTTAELLRRDLPGGRGLDANEVILIKANEATYKVKKSTDNTAGGFKLSYGGGGD
ncbi:MAG: hypothetical protein KKB50_06920 [Planctomycetes bacterium]|nr:hypothetical protein [Planctomycetota bacterium]